MKLNVVGEMATSILEKSVWRSLVGRHQHLSLGEGGARRYLPDVSPFAALRENNTHCLNDLASLASSGEIILLRDDIPPLTSDWEHVSNLATLQMILPAGPGMALQTGLRELGPKDIPAMLELTQLVLPGYFRARSPEMGTYFGIFEGPKLIAMTGERIFPEPLREITAVCTHPDYQGRGHAAKLVEHACARMRAAGLTPFLNTGQLNERAIALYRRLGFIDVGIVPLNGLRKI